ncbi:hypothetical protein PTKIN_Ptkin13bG0110900 [Pterospermum kingtungense]
MLLSGSGSGMNSIMDFMNLIQAQRHLVRDFGEEIELGDDDSSFANTPLISDLQQEPSAEEKKKVVKRWREEWTDTYKWAYVDVKEGTTRIFCSVCKEYDRKHRRNPYGNEGSRNMQISALKEHNNSLLHKEALRFQMASKDKIVVDKPIYVKALMSKMAGSIIEAALKRDPHEAEFIQSVQEAVHALERVIAKNSQGETHVNRGFRTLKNALSPYKLGGTAGRSDFDPKGKSDNEIMRFCQSFMNKIYCYFAFDKDLPSEEMGLGIREMGYLFRQYRRQAGNCSYLNI